MCFFIDLYENIRYFKITKSDLLGLVLFITSALVRKIFSLKCFTTLLLSALQTEKLFPATIAEYFVAFKAQ